uniref:SAM-dependent MTase TRM10-type domain-containing protein n=1 Tax=Anisakis simplex TaxID=6269 RepID=A0A0M3KJW2_ANISI
LRYIETKSWKEAFFKVIPKRRLADEEINGGSSDQGESGDPDCKRGRKDDENGESQTERGIEKDSVVGEDRGGSDMKSVTNGNGNGENLTGEKLEKESAGEDRRGADVTTVGEDNEDGERLSEKTVRERTAEQGQGEKD